MFFFYLKVLICTLIGFIGKNISKYVPTWLVPSNSHGNPPNIYDLIISTNTHADEIISGKYLLVSLSLLFTINPNGTKVRDNVKINRKVKRVETK